MTFPIPENEPLRLAHLLELRSDEWQHDVALQEICAITAGIMLTPVSLVCLLHATEACFVASIGVEIRGTPREAAFCSHTIMGAEPMLVADTAADARFASNPLVTHHPHFRAYAGIPLQTAPGIRVGTLCAIDITPRNFSFQQIELLCKLATVASSILISHKKRFTAGGGMVAASPPVPPTSLDVLHAFADAALDPPADGVAGRPSPALSKQAPSAADMHAEYRRAIDAGEFVPYYQPKFELQKRTLTGFEALARWSTATRGVLPPSAFLDLLDDDELASLLTRSMHLQMARDLRSWRAAGLEPGSLAINACAGDFQNENFAAEFLQIIDDHDLLPRDFVLEVTERIILEDHDKRLFNTLSHLRNHGVMIALDDFGTGYAGLQHLRKWPVNQVKIDRMFVQDCLKDSRDSAIVEAMIQMSDAIGLGVTAEGIETAEQLELLENLQCEMGQGDLFSRPMSSADVPEFVRKFHHWA